MLRRDIKNEISALDDIEREKKDEQIFNFLLSLEVLKGKVLSYSSLSSEVCTQRLNAHLMQHAQLFLPRVNQDALEIVPIVTGGVFIVGSFGISEPVGKEYNGDIDVCITPLCAFDTSLNRMGKGKGYYDRFLAQRNCLKIGIAYDLQERNFPVNRWDIPMDMIVTESRVLKKDNKQ